MKHKVLLYIAIFSCLLMGCKDTDDLSVIGDGLASNDIIHVGGINTDELIVTSSLTRTVDEETVTSTEAENISWLKEPLKAGLDITYGLYSNPTGNSGVAVLRLLTDTNGDIEYSTDTDAKKYAKYSFYRRDDSSGAETTKPAQWYSNGAHYFEGLYVPDAIEYETSKSETIANVQANLTSDQHDDSETGNYTMLSRYLGMPSNYRLNATVARIKLPFRHRLARVLAYILIDPEMGSGVKINGYKSTEAETTAGKDDPTTSDIRFSNVKVLAGVKDSYDETKKHHTYTPQWKEERKVIPHFVGERGSYNDRTNTEVDANSFIAYYNVSEKTYTYPDDSDWSTLNGYTYDSDGLSSDKKYKKISFGKVPVYDLIVEPTYTSTSYVMYDEDTSEHNTDWWNAQTNQIDFDITLSNDLQYSKRFNFDLNANYQTVVYLHISRERIDYNSSGSELWVETKKDDDYYGVNNQNGNTLSIAGSGWQRAYTNSETNYSVTDGHQYQWDSEDRYAQYVTDALWIEMLRQACSDGKHHGDYFILKNDISIPAAAFGTNFVFTGHLDGQGHTITLTDASYTAANDAYEAYNDASLTKYIKSGTSYVEFTPAANTTYYQKSGNTYTEITDMDAYAGSTAYTRTGQTTTYELVNVGTSYETTANYYYSKSGEDYSSIENIDTYLNAFDNIIYTRAPNPDSYTKVTSPSGNPKDQGWYELDGTTYKLTDDTEVSSGKTYYEASYTYTAVADAKTLSSTGSYYYKDNGESFHSIDDINAYIGVYTQLITYHYSDAINFYKFVHHASVIGTSTGTPSNGYMFSGLNGKYSTAQEDAEANNLDIKSVVWEANVHKETRGDKSYWVPYKTNNDGWRAEVMNLKVSGGKLFNNPTYPTTTTSGATVTGYVHSCWEKYGPATEFTKVTEYTPAIPVY